MLSSSFLIKNYFFSCPITLKILVIIIQDKASFKIEIMHYICIPGKRVVAQPGSALAWGARGRWFESSPPDFQAASIEVAFLFCSHSISILHYSNFSPVAHPDMSVGRVAGSNPVHPTFQQLQIGVAFLFQLNSTFNYH